MSNSGAAHWTDQVQAVVAIATICVLGTQLLILIVQLRHRLVQEQQTRLNAHHSAIVESTEEFARHYARSLDATGTMSDIVSPSDRGATVKLWFQLAMHVGHYETLALTRSRRFGRVGGWISGSYREWSRVMEDAMRSDIYGLYWVLDRHTYGLPYQNLMAEVHIGLLHQHGLHYKARPFASSNYSQQLPIQVFVGMVDLGREEMLSALLEGGLIEKVWSWECTSADCQDELRPRYEGVQ